MALKDVLVKLKLVEMEGVPRAATRAGGDSPELAELLARVPPPAPIDERKLAAASAGRRSAHVPAAAAPSMPATTAEPTLDIPDFADIYRAAGIVDAAHGFTAFKVLEILAAPALAALDGRAKASALAAFLKMNPAGAVPIADVLEDAVRRDQALDQFEKFLQAKLTERAAAADRDCARLQAELDELTRQNRELMASQRGAVDAARQRFDDWRERKRLEERRLSDAVAPFVESNPITSSPIASSPITSER